MTGYVITHLWQSTLFAIVAGALTLAFRGNRAKVRFGIWFAASLKFFVPFALLMSLGNQIRWTPAAHQIAAQYATPAVAFAVDYVSEPFAMVLVPIGPAASGVNWTLAAGLSLWICGFLAIATIRLRLWLRVRAAVRASSAVDIPAPVGIRSAPGLLEPGVVGLLRPILLLPEGIMERLTPSEMGAVLAHELCHVRRRDNLFAAVHMIAEAIFWFHPLVWWIGARMVEERERACDEDVLNLGSQPRVYADAIVGVCKLYAESPLVCVSGVSGANVRRRIEAIMMNRRGRTLNGRRRILLAAVGFAALAGPVVVGVLIGFGELPEIHAQSRAVPPAVEPELAPQLIAQAQTPAPPAASDPNPAVIRFQDRRLFVILFDFRETTVEQQERAKLNATQFIQAKQEPEDLAGVMSVVSGSVQIVQDFTASAVDLTRAIQGVKGDPSDVGAPDENGVIALLADVVGAVSQKKVLLYYSNRAAATGSIDEHARQRAIDSARAANLTIVPFDIGSTLPAAGLGRAMAVPPQLAAVFEGGFGTNAQLAPLVAGLRGEADFANIKSPFPNQNVRIQVYAAAPRSAPVPDRRFVSVIVPLDSLSGIIDVVSEVRTRRPGGDEVSGQSIANATDKALTEFGAHQAAFNLKPGSYVYKVLLREESTGRMFGEVVDFDVK